MSDKLSELIESRLVERKTLLDYIRDGLEEGVDYGRIHVMPKSKCQDGNQCTNPYHYSKPSLWKPGAEKIAYVMGETATWPEIVDELNHIKSGAQVVAIRCVLNPSGVEGIGARDIRSDGGDPNKALKMAKKSSLIDAVLTAFSLSEVFTQDLSDDDRPRENITLDDEGVDYLCGKAKELFPGNWKDVLQSLARRRFRIEDGDYKKIPDARLADAVRSLEEKAND